MTLKTLPAFSISAFIIGSALTLSGCQPRAQGTASSPKAASPGVNPASILELKAIGPYLFVRGGEGDSVFVVENGAHIDSVATLKKRFGSTFLWFRLEGRPYVVQDEAALQQVRDLFKEDATLEAREQALEAQDSKLDGQRDGLEARMDTMTTREEKLDEQEEALEEESPAASAARELLAKDRQALQQEMAGLEKEEQALEQQTQKLNQQQEELSKQQEQLAETAERQLQLRMMEFVKKGLAHPVNDKLK